MERVTIAANLASVLPAWSDREAVVRAAGLKDAQLAGEPRRAWLAIVEEAEGQGKLEALLMAAARRRPRNRALLAMAGLPVPEPRGGATGMWVGLGLLIAVGLIGNRWVSTPAPEATEHAGQVATDPAPAAAPAAVALAPIVVPPIPPPPPEFDFPPPPLAIPAAPPSRDVGKVEETPPSSDELKGLAAITEATVANARKAEAAEPGGRKRPGLCGGGVGYAYVTSGPVPKKGEVWEVPRSINVRKDHPRASNDWDAKAEVVCVLPPGTRVEVRDKPVAVQGGSIWVPVRDEALWWP